MRIVKETPFEFGYLHWQVRPPEGALMVFLKGTFDLVHDGDCVVSAEQRLIAGPAHWDDDPNQSLRVDGDFAVLKPRAECHFVGHAHAPGAEPVTGLLAGFRVGAVSRNVAVFGDRTFDAYGAMTPPVPFHTMPIRWERAFGGDGFARNPVGRGLAAVDTELGRRVPLPNLEDAAELITGPGDRPKPTCFGPVPPSWAERTRKSGTYGARWLKTRWPWLPEDFDYGYYNSAPPAQQIEGYWRGDEAIGLQHLAASRTVLRSRLPGIRGRCFAEVRRGGALEFVEVPLRLDTIVLDGDAERCECLWRGLLEGVSEKLTEVETFFFLHDAIDVERPLAHYQQWLERKRQEALAEEEELEAADPPEEPLPPVPRMPRASEVLANLAHQLTLEGPGEGVTPADHAKVIAQVTAMSREPPEPPGPKPSEVRAQMEAGGVEVPDDLAALPDDELVLPDDDDAEEADEPEAPGMTREDVLRSRAYGQSLAGVDLTGVDLTELDLTGEDFSGSILAGANLQECVLREATLEGAVLTDADLTRADLSGAKLAGADLTGAHAPGVDAQGADFTDVVAERSVWTGARLRKAVLKGADFTEATVTACDLREVDGEGLDLTRALGERCHFEQATLLGATLAGGRFAHAVFDDAVLTNLRADEGTDLTAASFRRAVAGDAHFEEARMEGAQLGEAVLDKAELARARLAGADFTAASMLGARLHEASLVGAVLLRVNAMEAIFEGADLRDADLRGANLTAASLWRARLQGAQTELALLHRSTIDPEVAG